MKAISSFKRIGWISFGPKEFFWSRYDISIQIISPVLQSLYLFPYLRYLSVRFLCKDTAKLLLKYNILALSKYSNRTDVGSSLSSNDGDTPVLVFRLLRMYYQKTFLSCLSILFTSFQTVIYCTRKIGSDYPVACVEPITLQTFLLPDFISKIL